MKRIAFLVVTLPALLVALAGLPFATPSKPFHTAEELRLFRQYRSSSTGSPRSAFTGKTANGNLPIDSSILFPTALTCAGCHGHDPLGFALVTNSGEDVNIYDDWRSSMMANSARDPFWRAKVSHEILVNPAHSLELQDKCTSCHAPAGHYQAKLKNHQLYYTLADLYADTLGLDGVTCQICHAQAPENLGSLHSGELYFDTNHIRVAYGPYELPFAPPMRDFVGITPKYGEHISDAGLCAGCHTLITNTVDLNGQFTGATFVEQATYHEWLNSRYDKDHDNISCQSCHLPQIPDEVIISANYQFLTPQFPFGLHEMAGANITMLKLMKENRDKLAIPAGAEQFDSTIAATLRMLQHKTLDLDLTPQIQNGDTAVFALRLLNKAGHKFPSGYPSRRAWVEFVVQNGSGDTLFHSGKFNPVDYSLPDEDALFEPHYQVINHTEQVQIYELAPGDVNGAFTTVLERAAVALKDNRLTPQGFRLNDPAYDTTRIVGRALVDPDFNRHTDGTEGSGSDILYFHVPISGYTGVYRVTAKVWYQSLPPKWMTPMFTESSPEIDSFRLLFDAADRAPVLVAETVLEDVMVSPVAVWDAWKESVKIVPTLSPDGHFWLEIPEGTQIRQVQVWNSAGRLVWDKPVVNLHLGAVKGVYYVDLLTNRGRVVRKVVVQ